MPPDDALKIDRLQHDILAPQLESFLAASPAGEARESYLALRDAVEGLEIPNELTARLGAVAEVLLSSGRVRSLYGPGAELSLWSLFQKTSRGRDITASIDAANAAFKRLAGQPIEILSAIARSPGAYALTIKTAELQIVVRFEHAGIRVENLEVGTG